MADYRSAPIPEEITDRQTGENPCYICGAGTSNEYELIVAGGGGVAVHPDDEDEALENDAGFMGRHPVGSECRKKMPAGFVIEASEPAADRVETLQVEKVKTYGWLPRTHGGREVEFEIHENEWFTKVRSTEPVALGKTRTGKKLHPVHLTGQLTDDGLEVRLEQGRYELHFAGWNDEG